MILSEAMRIFGFSDLESLTSESIEERYRALVLAYHPYAQKDKYTEYHGFCLKKVNEAYTELRMHIFGGITADEIKKEKINVEKAKILMDIMVKAYFDSKEEIDRLNGNLMNRLLSTVPSVGNVRVPGTFKNYIGGEHVEEVFRETARRENNIMEENIKKYATIFAEKYGIEMSQGALLTGHYINFLNGVDWYGKYINYSDDEISPQTR